MSAIDLTGQRFSRLTVTKRVGRDKASQALWLCKCLCGQEKIVQGKSLKAGLSRSCGCLRKETSALTAALMGRKNAGNRHALKHGQSGYAFVGKKPSPTYISWRALCQRVLDPNSKSYATYGGATPPITICDRWNPKAGGSFENFLADVGERLPGTTLGRFGDVGNYEVGNVSWMTPAEQVSNWRPDRIRSWSKNKIIVEQVAA